MYDHVCFGFFVFELFTYGCIGIFAALMLKLYVSEKLNKDIVIEALSVSVAVFTGKNYVARLITGPTGAHLFSVNYHDCLSWLAFGLGYLAVMVYLFKKPTEEHIFTANILKSCLLLTLCLFLSASESYLLFYL